MLLLLILKVNSPANTSVFLPTFKQDFTKYIYIYLLVMEYSYLVVLLRSLL